MDEMQLLRDWGQCTLVDGDELAPARARLAAAIKDDRRRPRRRLVWAGVTAVGLAAAISGVIALAPVEEIGFQVPTAHADPVQVLRNAAAAALKLPDTPPRADQFVYTKTQAGEGIREAWRSADGTHGGLIKQDGGSIPIPECVNGKEVIVNGNSRNGQTQDCVPYPAYIPDLPTDADAMLAYLNNNHSGEPGDVNALGKDVLALASESYLRPQSWAALFEAAARIPGLTAVENVKDGAGRPGIGISWSTAGKGKPGSTVLVLDTTTYAYLGTAGGDAVLESAIVDKVGG